jgi:hypothetical protein
MSKDPPRLRDDPASSELSDALRQASPTASPSDEVRRAIKARLEGGLPPGGGPSMSTGGWHRSGSGWTPAGWLKAAAALGIAGASLGLYLAASDGPAAGSRAASSSREADAVPRVNDRRSPTARFQARPVAADAPSGDALERARGEVSGASASEKAGELEGRRLPSGAPRKAPARPRARDPLSVEEELVERARSTLEADPAASLRVLEVHQRRFPQGELVAERELLAVEALMREGARAAAVERGRAFLERFPASPYAHLVRQRLAASGSEDGIGK